LDETQIPAFERSLARFLAEDRVTARQAIDRNHLTEAEGAVAAHCRLHEDNLGKSVDELKAKLDALQPKLEELRRVGVHIKNFLSAVEMGAAEELPRSFDEFIEERVRKPLPAAVEKFDLGPLDSLFVSFKMVADLWQPEGKRFRDLVTVHMQRQITNY